MTIARVACPKELGLVIFLVDIDHSSWARSPQQQQQQEQEQKQQYRSYGSLSRMAP